MGYKLNGNTIVIDVPFTDSEGTSYPSNWLRNASDSEKAAVPTGGITWVPDAPYQDERFYFQPGNIAKPIADLKTVWINEQKRLANGILESTDWMVVRAAEGGTALPSATKTLRGNVRTVSKTREDQITACSDTDALSTLINTAEGESGGLTAWPTS